MGTGAAMDIKVYWTPPDGVQDKLPAVLQNACAPGRRVVLARGYESACVGEVTLDVSYADLDERPYQTKVDGGASTGGTERSASGALLARSKLAKRE